MGRMAMKNIKEILNSGILHRYVVGETSPEEDNELYEALQLFPELKEHLNVLEENLMQLGLENAIDPPRDIKLSVLKQIEKTGNNKKKLNAAYSWMLLAACLVLAMGIFTYSVYTKSQDYNQQLTKVSEEYNQLKDQVEALKSSLTERERIFDILSDPETGKYVLKGNSISPNALAVGYVNKNLKEVYIDTKQLPTLSNDKDYQLWADVEGEMINMGVVKPTTNLLAMNYIENAESINLTIEPAGGSEHPTVSNLIANAYIE